MLKSRGMRQHYHGFSPCSRNGEKILYAVYPIEKVGQDETLSKSTTKDRIPQSSENVKETQFDIIQATLRFSSLL